MTASRVAAHHPEVRWPRRVQTAAEAVRLIDAVGFCLLFPVEHIPLPSLYYAMARRTRLTWDHHSAKLWQWKDELPLKRRALYTKFFRGRGTFISRLMLPSFLAMRESPRHTIDYDTFYAAGRISHDAHALWKVLAEHGPLGTLELRHACRMESKAGNARFKKAMLELQGLLVVTHFGAEQETAAWASNRLELIARAFPQEAQQSRRIPPEVARSAIARKYVEWHRNANPSILMPLWGWSRAQAVAAMAGPQGSSSPCPPRQ
jgi:hypothetical protein